MREAGGGRLGELEVLRAVAILYVLVEHISTLLPGHVDTIEPFFYGGVDLFFCISGFVITSGFAASITAARATNRFGRAVGAFYIRRAFRILPLAGAAFVFTLAVSVAIFGAGPDLLAQSRADALAILFNVQNLHYGLCVQSGAAYCGQFGVYWSLSLEEQFYLVFPFLFLLRRRYLVVLLLAVAALFAWLPRTTMVWMVRLDAISLGVLLGLARGSLGAIEPTWLGAALPRRVCTPLLLIAMVAVPYLNVPSFPIVVSAICLALVFVASFGKGYLVGESPLRALLIWIGQRSFAIYLLHQAVFWMVSHTGAVLMPPSWQLSLVSIAAAAVLLAVIADISFRLLETPLRLVGKGIADAFAMGEKSQPAAVAPT
ncbi:peptidoglycan/LPS O-acetylase OafA/YrhL [Bradyrhizobium sp. CIR48]|uniref:acyltransferase family protein n=1 Tax=Bradyrhizobium sp. CIR48 TaxID=2663840 RepID=UPI0016064203|nr:acyltransferase [Bradyrhizobium sp. CIR48]MBB4428356.1 peptidoglycan/LPS O-acetylase OafA/YrhL [Bradyrhizobium sp. CIR48]